MDAGRYRAGVDIGGTFTDLLLLDEDSGDMVIGKVLTTPGDPSVAVIQGLRTLLRERQLDPARIMEAIHGTTLITNAIIERKGAKTGLITTQGFRDALEIGREKRYDIYDIFLENPPPLIPRALRREVAERLDETGRVLVPLNRMEVLEVVQRLVQEGVEALAVCLLHSFRNPAHERAIREVVESEFPTLALSLSSDVMPEIREFERTSTTAANVYVKPLARRYLMKLREQVQQLGLSGELYIMLSNGGITTCETASEYPIRLIESGPAAGALAASFYSQLQGLEHVISFDMGGTTAKICVIDQGHPMVTTEFEVARVYRFKKGSGLPVKVPVIEMIEIGALRQIVCPLAAGVTSAFGFLVAPMAFDFVQTYLTTLPDIDFTHLHTIFAEMEARGRALLRHAGVPEAAIIEERESTLVIGPGARVDVDPYQNVVLQLP
jgi:N-methylhydantoinase A